MRYRILADGSARVSRTCAAVRLTRTALSRTPLPRHFAKRLRSDVAPATTPALGAADRHSGVQGERGKEPERSEEDGLSRQYADDRNLAARQRLWRISRSEPELDVNRWSVELLAASAPDLVLDAGCGNGGPLSLLRQTGCTTIGVDRSLGMLRSGVAPPATVGDVQALPFGTGVFDAAAAFMMLYHVPDRLGAARELRRVVRRGGVVVATTASSDNQPELRTLVEAAVGGEWRWTRPSESQFSLEGAVGILGSAFDDVQVVRAPDRRIFVTDAQAMADYVASTEDHHAPSLPPGRGWDDVVESVRFRTVEAIADGGALVVTARLGALVCR